jgi:uncharacterized glyoxalase superfamily protein PhnB
MPQSIPFLLFDGNCAEATSFYHQGLGGNLTITKLGKSPMKDRFQDLHPMPFGTYGQFYDQYGVQWIFKGDVRV